MTDHKRRKPPEEETSQPPPDEEEAYRVGYGRPPKHSQFRKGQSGYPSGRPPGVSNFGSDVRRVMRTKVAITRNGRKSRVSLQFAMLMRLADLGLTTTKNVAALIENLRLGAAYNDQRSKSRQSRILSDAEKEILADFARTLDGNTSIPSSSEESFRHGTDKKEEDGE